MGARVLGVVERRSPVSRKVYEDVLFFCAGMSTQFGGMDLVLRGMAVSCAMDAPTTPVDRGRRDGPPGPQRRLRSLIATGARVWVDESDLADSHAAGTLLEGAVIVDTDAMARRWHEEHEEVWFL